MTEKQNKITFSQLIQPMSVRSYWISVVVFSLLLQWLIISESFNKLSAFIIGFLWIFTVAVTQSLGHTYIRKRLIDRWFSWEKTPVKKLIALVVAMVVYAALAYVLVAVCFAYSTMSISLARAFEIGTMGIKTSVIITFIFAFIFSSISFYINWQKSRIKAKELEADLANYRYESLKKQVNPHFLFNSLNVLADLVHEDADLSEKYIHQLSKIYRYVLESAKLQTVPLKDELKFIEAYAFLLDIRFGKKITFDININPKQGDSIIPVSLQTLIENAVKHNEVTNQNPLTISISQKDNFIIVENNLQLKKIVVESSGTGLENIQQQYALLSDELISIEQTDDVFRVSLPILS